MNMSSPAQANLDTLQTGYGLRLQDSPHADLSEHFVSKGNIENYSFTMKVGQRDVEKRVRIRQEDAGQSAK